MRYTIIGGINGAGKSTVYSVLSEKEKADLGHRVNVDDIVADMGDWRDVRTQITAGKIAVSRIKEHLHSCQSFHQETTLSGRSIIRTATEAKNKGFYVCLSRNHSKICRTIGAATGSITNLWQLSGDLRYP